MSEDVSRTTQQVSSSDDRGFQEFCLKKSNSVSLRNLDTASIGDTDVPTPDTSVRSQDDCTVERELSGSFYGNYVTVSGTGANILRDIFRKQYRVGEQEKTVAEKGTKKRISFGQTTFLGFRLKKEKGHDAGIPDTESRSKSASKESKDIRRRYKSGPEQECCDVAELDFESKLKSGKMRTFLDQFRTRPRPDSGSSSSAAPAVSVFGKGKKFTVAPVKKEKEPEIGPREFIEMYRNRAFSDTRPEDVLTARTSARRHRLSVGFTAFGKSSVDGFENNSDKRHYIVWRDKRKGTKIYQLPSPRSVSAVRDDFGDPNDADLAFVRFLKAHSCYDLIPSSSKLVIFDTQLTVKKAFLALVQNGVRAALLWDTATQDFAGMLTVSDFIQVLQKYYHFSQDELSEVENNKILTWKELLDYKRKLLVHVSPASSLFDAVKTLHSYKVHRLLIVDDHLGNPLNLLSHKRIAKFLHENMQYLQRPSFMDRTLEELNVGTYENLGTLRTDAPLIEALNLFVLRRVSAIPIVDNEGRAVDVFAKIDIIGLIDEQLYRNLDVSVEELLKGRRENFRGVLTCKRTETLQEVVTRIITSAVHRLLVIDERERVLGVVSLSDILHFLVLRQSEMRKCSSSGDQSESTELSFDTKQDESDVNTEKKTFK